MGFWAIVRGLVEDGLLCHIVKPPARVKPRVGVGRKGPGRQATLSVATTTIHAGSLGRQAC